MAKNEVKRQLERVSELGLSAPAEVTGLATDPGIELQEALLHGPRGGWGRERRALAELAVMLGAVLAIEKVEIFRGIQLAVADALRQQHHGTRDKRQPSHRRSHQSHCSSRRSSRTRGCLLPHL